MINSMEELVQPIKGSRILVIPSPPTPNGGLHLGHIAGPYLRSDLYARFMKIRGADVRMLFGVDAFDLYMSCEAEKHNKTEEQVIAQNYAQIEKDLKVANIGYDEFINPVVYRAQLEQYARTLYDLQKDNIEVVRMPTQYFTAGEMAKVLPPKIQSDCLICGDVLYGNTCETCGGTFNIYDLKNCSHSGEALAHADDTFICLKIAELNAIQPDRYPPLVSDVVSKVLEYYKGVPYLNLVHSFDWGVNLTHGDLSYRLTTYSNRYVFNYLYGERYKQLTGDDVNPYAAESDVTIVSFFGKDNITSNIVKKNNFNKSNTGLKVEDHYVANDFYLYDNRKFSTSRNHKVTFDEMIDRYQVTADEVRFFLTLTSPSSGETNFTFQSFEECMATWLQPLKQKLLSFTPADGAGSAVNPSVLDQGKRLLVLQYDFMGTEHFRPEMNFALFEELIDTDTKLFSEADRCFWMKVSLLLVYPIMPTFTAALWLKCFGETPLAFDTLLRYEG